MKFLKKFLPLALCLAWSAVCPAANASSEEEVIKILKMPVLTPEELSRVSFSASLEKGYSTPLLGYSLHNPFRDRIIEGIVLTVEDKKAATPATQSTEQFVTVRCAPLCNVLDQIRLFGTVSGDTPNLTVSLKEVHYSTPDVR